MFGIQQVMTVKVDKNLIAIGSLVSTQLFIRSWFIPRAANAKPVNWTFREVTEKAGSLEASVILRMLH